MPARVLINTSQFSVSKPGVDVTTASLDQLLLSINARVGQVLFSGYIAGTSGTISYSTLPAFPDAIAQIIWIAGLGPGGGTFLSQTLFYAGPPLVKTTDFWINGVLMQIAIGTSATVFTASASSSALIEGIRYVIFRKPMAA